MKMQLITIRLDKFGIENGFKIKRELFDECGHGFLQHHNREKRICRVRFF